MITQELMRELLNDELSDIRQIAEFVPNEIVYRALVIREFMEKRGIAQPRDGIREFAAFERERIRALGLAGHLPAGPLVTRGAPPPPLRSSQASASAPVCSANRAARPATTESS